VAELAAAALEALYQLTSCRCGTRLGGCQHDCAAEYREEVDVLAAAIEVLASREERSCG